MIDNNNDVQQLITTIKEHTTGDMLTTGAVTLLNLIPYAGGAIASVISEYATNRRFDKICDVLSDLNANLESQGTDPEKHLSKDQIIEVVHETLQTVTISSDQKKITYLKNGLGYAFLSDDTFERKQLFLQVLRGCTSIELAVLRALYNSNDPYLVYKDPPVSDQTNFQLGDSSSMIISTDQYMPQGYWEPVANKDECGKEALLTFLAKQVGFDQAITESATQLLDSKSLSKSGQNLFRKDCKVLQWKQHSNIAVTAQIASFNTDNRVRSTPLEASRTKFGEDFLKFCK